MFNIPERQQSRSTAQHNTRQNNVLLHQLMLSSVCTDQPVHIHHTASSKNHSMPTLITALWGFKLHPSTLDVYLSTRGDAKLIYGTSDGRVPPQYRYNNRGSAHDHASVYLRFSAGTVADTSCFDFKNILVVLPFVEPHEQSPWVYVAYSYRFVYSQLHITPDSPPEPMPTGFEELRRDILYHCALPADSTDQGEMGFFIVRTDNRSGPLPAEIKERREVCLGCLQLA